MPELPEVETVRRQLARSLRGKRILAVAVRSGKMVHVGVAPIPARKLADPARTLRFKKGLAGRSITGLRRRAKYLVIDLSGGAAIMVHLRMSGQLIYRTAKQRLQPLRLSLAATALPQLLPGKHTHVVLEFVDSSALFYNDTRQFGHLRFVSSAAEHDAVFLQAGLGPEPLDLGFAEFNEIIAARPNRAIKSLLLDQQAIAGIGNIYADEALFAAKIKPLRRAGSLSQQERKALLAAIIKILQRAIASGGSSMEYFLKTNGSAGSFAHEHNVYGKAGEHCPRCPGILQSVKIGSRTSVFCPLCQK